MTSIISNLVFEGAGTHGISYLGVLDFLMHNNWMEDVKRVAGTSSGAITACITSLNLPFAEINKIVDTLDYHKVPAKSDLEELKFLTEDVKELLDMLFGDFNCIYRLVNHYGWYSTEYFYDWIKKVIADQFDPLKKAPPYTFADFKNSSLHKNNQPFRDLYIIGSNLSAKSAQIFSYESTPLMEVAKAVRISMSIPVFFEAVEQEETDTNGNQVTNIYCDGGAIKNYPLTIFDSVKYNNNLYYGANMETLGVHFMNRLSYSRIDNLLQYVESLMNLSTYIQQDIYESNPLNKVRSIVIDPGDVSPMNFDIITGDDTYQYLYHQGYQAAYNFFSRNRPRRSE